jgi:tetratricopeptide (TPR) repeat protein
VTGAILEEVLAAREELAGVAPDRLYDRLERNDAELQVALRALGDSPDDGLEVVAVLWPYWVARSRLREGRAWIDEFLAGSSSTAPSSCRAKSLYGAGMIAFLLGEIAVAEGRLNECLLLARDIGEGGIEADALVSLARVAMLQRDHVAMEERSLESARAAHRTGDERRYATALHHQAEALRRQHRYDEAEPLYREAIERHDALGDRRSIALELHNYGRLARATGDARLAADRFRESLAGADTIKHERLVAYCLLGLANLAASGGDLGTACRLIGAADARIASVGAALEPEYAGERDEMVVRAREVLGAERSAHELDAGAALGFADSVSLGLSADILAV